VPVVGKCPTVVTICETRQFAKHWKGVSVRPDNIETLCPEQREVV